MLQIFTEVLFLIFALRSVFFWVNLWQLKEYRLDRLFIHLRDTKQGNTIIFSSEVGILIGCFLLYFLSVSFDGLTVWYPYVVFSLFLFFVVKTIREGIQRRLKRPILTVKAISISAIALLLLCVIVMFPLTDPFFWLVCAALTLPYVVALVVFVFAFPTEIYTDIYIQKAKEKRKHLKKLVVIAVSGSYGKSSTKEVIAHVLSKKFSVVKTNLSNNTPLALAKAILTQIKENTDIFVAELGAYKRGEIAVLCDIVGPTISVTTAVSDQHLALYGDMHDVIASEMELITRTPKNALTLLNGDSQGVHELSKKIKNKKIIWYTTIKKSSQSTHTFSAYNVTPTTAGVNWRCQYKQNVISFHSPLLGEHTVSNILPAVILGLHFGLLAGEIEKAVRSLRPLSKTMEKVISVINGVTCIDDSFNASPESVSAAIDYLNLYSKGKILVLSPLIELGKMGKIRHFELGQQMAGIDTVFLTNKNFYTEIEKGIHSVSGNTKLITGTYASLAKLIHAIANKGDIVLFEGKEAGIVFKYL